MPHKRREIIDGKLRCAVCSKEQGSDVFHLVDEFYSDTRSKVGRTGSCKAQTLLRWTNYNYRDSRKHRKPPKNFDDINRNNLPGFTRYFTYNQFLFKDRFNVEFTPERAKEEYFKIKKMGLNASLYAQEFNNGFTKAITHPAQE
jgi:hypothetical protein